MSKTNNEIEFVHFEVKDFAEKLVDLKDDPNYKDSSDLAWCELSEFAQLSDVIDWDSGIIDFNVWEENTFVICLEGRWGMLKDRIFQESEICYFSEEASKAVAKVATDTDWEEVED